jgi:hypothetical protein
MSPVYLKQSIQEAEPVDGGFSVRVRLNNRAAVRAFAAMMVTKSRLIERRL